MQKENTFQTHFVWILLIAFLVIIGGGQLARGFKYLKETVKQPAGTNRVIHADVSAFRETNAPVSSR